MSDVKRYEPFGCDGLSALMYEDDLGGWVPTENYEALEIERDALAQRCRELEHMLKHARIDADTHYADTLTLRAEVERLRHQVEAVAVRCTHNGGYLCSRDLIELRELLKK